jgi:hypothetical protein
MVPKNPGASPQADGGGAPPARANTIRTADRLALDDAFLTHENLRHGISENLKARRIEDDKTSKRVDKAFAKLALSQPAVTGRGPTNHVDPTASTFDALKAVVDRRVEKMRKSDPAPRISVRDRSRLVTWDAASSDGDDNPTGSLELAPLLGFVNIGQAGAVSASAPTGAELVAADREAERVLDEVQRPANADEPQIARYEAVAAEDRDVDALVANSVNVQMASATAPEDRLTYGLIPNSTGDDKTQAGLLQTFQLQPGASDVTAYHDFHTLQIAFEHVWTRLFDGDVARLGRELYKEYVDLKDFLGYDPNADRPITSLDDLKWLIAEIRSLSQSAQQAIPPQLGGNESSNNATDNPKGANDIAADAARVAGAIATGGLTAVAEAIINEISKLANKPVKHWVDLNGRKLDRGDRITATFVYDVAPVGMVQLVLRTDVGSHWKGFKHQYWHQPSNQFLDFISVTNAAMNVVMVNGRQFYEAFAIVPLSLLPNGAIEFSSEQSPGFNLGRYILIDLAEGDKIKSRAQVTFYWQDN